jgi:molybdate transport system substrate-binding protein
MLNSRTMKLAVGLSAAVVMSHAPADAATITLRIAVAPNFANAANEIAASFAGYYSVGSGLTYSVGISVEDDASFQAEIAAAGTTGAYDLYLGSSHQAIQNLTTSNASLVLSTFNYAKDVLELYSPSIDVTGGLPYPLTTTFVMPNPATDNIGMMAADVLANGPWQIPESAIPGGFVATGGSSNTTYSAIKRGKFPYGFVGRSQICTYSDGTFNFIAGSYHADYGPPQGARPPTPLHLTAATLVSTTRTADQNTALANLVAFITGTADTTGVTTTQGLDLIQSHCFDLP